MSGFYGRARAQRGGNAAGNEPKTTFFGEVIPLDSIYTSYAKIFSQRAIQRTRTAAANDETVLAYRVAIPRQRLR